MNHPMPTPGSLARPAAAQVTEQVVEERLASLASLDIAEHARVYEQLLHDLQQDLNRTGGGTQ
ncbi:hypothetical protein [Glutamicibacter creatinolyticus]|jgi:hypothetical protein|uniref:hypothetical protein n=1 Tax=Glutamicibacter TaxID=1742989 RepID=UPI0037C1016D